MPKQSLWLSNMDLLHPRYYLPTVYLYKPNGSANFFEATMLKEALGRVLVPFYPVAGRLARDENGRIEINCNGEGVFFVVADTYSTTKELDEFMPSMELRQLIPTVDSNLEDILLPIALSGDLLSESFMCTVERIHREIKKMDEEYLRSALDYLEELGDVGDVNTIVRGSATCACPNLTVISWMQLPFFKADFGWGAPLLMRPATMFEGKGYIHPDLANDGSFSLALYLETDYMESFRKLFYKC
ncbi:hypothetical protein Peur_024741 [Populus x canadensis]